MGASSNQITENFNFKLQRSVNQGSEADPSLAWTYNIPVLNVNEKYLFLVT